MLNMRQMSKSDGRGVGIKIENPLQRNRKAKQERGDWLFQVTVSFH